MQKLGQLASLPVVCKPDVCQDRGKGVTQAPDGGKAPGGTMVDRLKTHPRGTPRWAWSPKHHQERGKREVPACSRKTGPGSPLQSSQAHSGQRGVPTSNQSSRFNPHHLQTFELSESDQASHGAGVFMLGPGVRQARKQVLSAQSGSPRAREAQKAVIISCLHLCAQ